MTPAQELLDRYSGRIKMRDYAKPKVYDQSLPHKLLRGGARPEEGWTVFEADDHHHWSVWRTEDFVALVKRLKLNVIEVQDVDDKVGNGFTVVIRK